MSLRRALGTYPTTEILESDEIIIEQRGAGSSLGQINPLTAVLGGVGIIRQ